ncbi:MAG: AraC family transcriptional regulator [Ruminococcus sp.]|nr:AraC family transcriptional regulator [Ruminococcus sp.]MDD6634939.1 AraC family transcriptional regulator [Ruminococcus sp.]MDY3845108.1 AraC family transcriptional regulator [Ruminococcus sp.]CDF02526.1 putative AraC-type Regulator [Ruminococcus sp. CAG:624]
MIKNLLGDYETVEYENKRFVMLYDNVETETYPTHWHNAVEIIMPLQNSFVVYIGETKYVLNEREIIIIPPGELHTLPSQEGRRIIFQCDNSVLADASALEAVSPVLAAPIYINPEIDKNLYIRAKKGMLDIYSEYYSGSEISDVKIYMYLIGMLVAVREYQLQQYRISFPCEKNKLLEYNEKFSMVLKYIDKNYMYDISLDKLADIAGYSKYHFSRIFKQYNSMSYLQYINTRRTRAAEMLLLDPSIPITEVAMRSGFSSLTTFNRIFKEIKHCTPSDFKKFYSSNEAAVINDSSASDESIIIS